MECLAFVEMQGIELLHSALDPLGVVVERAGAIGEPHTHAAEVSAGRRWDKTESQAGQQPTGAGPAQPCHRNIELTELSS